MRTIAHISDLHFGRVDASVAEGLVADLAEMKPDIVVASGDLTQRARRWQFAAAAEYLARLPRPVIVTPGNHDIPLYDVIRRFLSPLGRYRGQISAELMPFYRDEEVAILAINSALPFAWCWNGFWKEGRVDDEQLRKMKAQFEAVPPEVTKIVVTHHPFIPPPKQLSKRIIGNAAAGLEALAESGVEVLLAGHLHCAYCGDVRKIHKGVKRPIFSVQAGTAISHRTREEPNSYNVIVVDGEHMSVQVRAWGGQGFKEQSMAHHRLHLRR